MAQRTVGETIRTLRDVQGLTQIELAVAAGIDRSHLARIETGVVSPGLVTLAKVARALKVKSSQLLQAT
jgi:transcriptional regulator with XRE-family HTH domain